MTVGSNKLYFGYDASGTPLRVAYNGTTYYYVTNLQGDVIAILNSSGTAVVQYTYDAWGNPISTTGSMATTLGATNPLRYRGYVYDQETNLYYLQSRYYNPKTGRFLNADAFTATGQGLLGGNTIAYCGNNPVAHSDPTGHYINSYDPTLGPGLSKYFYIGGNATGVSTATASGGGGGFSIAVVGLTIPEVFEVVDTVSDVVDIANGFGDLSHASEYGIKGYSELRADIAGTDLQAHHIVEQRFLKGKNMKVQTTASVAVSPQEHQKFTNLWRRHFAYGKQNYKALDKYDIWEAAQNIYHDYPELLEAAWDIIKLMD